MSSEETTAEETVANLSPAVSPVPDVTEESSKEQEVDEQQQTEVASEKPDEEDEDEAEADAEEEEEEHEEVNEEHVCHLCSDKLKEPRVLSCLHVFCTECLKKQLEPATPEGERPAGEAEVICNLCGQDTKIAQKGIEDLPLDHVMVNTLDMEAILKMQIICTSCKAKEKAVARCSDCANFLCPNCVTAHQYMRCFENHKVVSFEEMRNDEGFALHKPLFCTTHPSENLKYFCITCQMPICTECMVTEHRQPDHDSTRLSDMDDSFMATLQKLVTEAKGKVQFCEDASSSLENALTELQEHRDNARGLIVETFQSYKALIEKRKDSLLEELEEIHSHQEDHIMHVFHNVGKIIERIEDGCKFTERTLEQGNNVEILLMKRIVAAQLLTLINDIPKPDVNVNINFETDPAKFEECINNFFGSFKKEKNEDLHEETPATSLHSSFENEGISLPSGLLSPTSHASDILPPVTGATADFMPSLPPLSMANLHTILPPSIMSGVSPQTINSIASSIQSLSSVPPPQTTSTVERSSSRNSYSPAMSDSGISVDAASNGSGVNQAVVNVAALAKLGTVSVNHQGQITLNGQIIPGLTVNNVSGLSQVLANRAPTPTTPMTPMTPNDPALVNLLGMNPPSVLPRPITPQLGDVTNLLTQPPTVNTHTGLNGAVASGLSPPAPGSAFTLHSHPPFPPRNSSKVSHMQIRCKFGQLGPGKSQFNSPHGFCLGIDEDIVVADTNNHRIQVFEKTGEFKYQFGFPGREEGQMWYPRKVAVIRHSGKYVVCDRGNERSRMQIFTKNGHFIKKIAIRYIDIVAGLAISHAGHIVAVDSVSPTVFIIAESGDLIKWFDCSDYMREPSDIAVNGKEYFVCDFKGHCVVVFNEAGVFMRRIGCENVTNFPNGIDISDAGDVLVGDSHGNRFHVAVFQRDGALIGEFECPYVKVSRCCGLKITGEGYVVTLAKNNHHVLVLNTLYIT